MKTSGVKRRLFKKTKLTYSVPTWVIAKTKRHVVRSAKKRTWKRGRLKVA